MKLKVLLPFSLCLSVFACQDKDKQASCETKVCTMEYATATVLFNDQSGQPVAVKEYSAVIKRTGQPTLGSAEKLMYPPGTYAVASDGDKNNLSESGDTIIVSGIHPNTNQKKSTAFVISGGLCACHIQKKSGASTITFD